MYASEPLKQTKSPRAVSIIPAREAKLRRIDGKKRSGEPLAPPAVGQKLAIGSQGCGGFPRHKVECWKTLRAGPVFVGNIQVGGHRLRAILDAHPIELKPIAKG